MTEMLESYMPIPVTPIFQPIGEHQPGEIVEYVYPRPGSDGPRDSADIKSWEVAAEYLTSRHADDEVRDKKHLVVGMTTLLIPKFEPAGSEATRYKVEK